MKYFYPLFLLFFSFTLSEQQQKNIGLKVVELQEENFAKRIPAYGSVIDTSSILSLRSDWLNARAMWKKSQAALAYSEKNYERQKKLFQTENNVSEKIFQQAEMLYLTDQVSEATNYLLLGNLKQRIQLNWGEKILKWVVHNTPEIKKLAEEELALVQISLSPAETLFQIPKHAILELAPHTVQNAEFVSVSPQINPSFQNRSFFYMAENLDHLLLPGKNVKAYLLSESLQKGVVVVLSAVVSWQGKSWVFVQKGVNEFERQEIDIDFAVKGGWFVRKGLKNHDRLVVIGAQELLGEELASSGEISKAQLIPSSAFCVGDFFIFLMLSGLQNLDWWTHTKLRFCNPLRIKNLLKSPRAKSGTWD